MSIPFVIEITIGLILIYLTLSLLASQIQELISSLLQWKAVHLRQTINSLLSGSATDSKYVSFQQAQVLADQIYSSPLIKQLNQEAKGLEKILRSSTYVRFVRSIWRKFLKCLKWDLDRVNRVFGDQESGPSYIASGLFRSSIYVRFVRKCLKWDLDRVNRVFGDQESGPSYIASGFFSGSLMKTLGLIEMSKLEVLTRAITARKIELALETDLKDMQGIIGPIEESIIKAIKDNYIELYKTGKMSLPQIVKEISDVLEEKESYGEEGRKERFLLREKLLNDPEVFISKVRPNAKDLLDLLRLTMNLVGEISNFLNPLSPEELVSKINHDGSVAPQPQPGDGSLFPAFLLPNDLKPSEAERCLKKAEDKDELLLRLIENRDVKDLLKEEEVSLGKIKRWKDQVERYRLRQYSIRLKDGTEKIKAEAVKLKEEISITSLDRDLSTLEEIGMSYLDILSESDEVVSLLCKVLGKLRTSIPPELFDNLSSLAEGIRSKHTDLTEEIESLDREVGNWYDRVMERASGVYNRNAKVVAIFVGICVAIAANADTFYMVHQLSIDSTLRGSIVTAAEGFADPPDGVPDLDQVQADVETALESVPLPIGWGEENKQKQACYHNLTTWPFPCQDKDSEVAKPAPSQSGGDQSPWLKYGSLLVKFVLILGGWLVSGIAISMGASFWYDLLDKVINVKNVGKKPPVTPESNPSSSPSTETSQGTPKPTSPL